MGISLKSQKALWGRAASLCSICRRHLDEPIGDGDDLSLVGEACHIVAQSPDGPRGDASMPEEQRDHHSNLILLCNIHHKIVDDDPVTYTVEKLHEYKALHIKWVRDNLSPDEATLVADEYYVGVLEDWERMCSINEWDHVTDNFFFAAQNRILKDVEEKMWAYCGYIIRRHWPNTRHDIESAFLNYFIILQDFLNVFNEHKVPLWEGTYQYEKFYKIDEWNPERYRSLANQYDYNTALLCDLLCELTRAGNWIIALARGQLISNYRNNEGRLAVISGDILKSHTYVLCYRESDLTGLKPYNNLAAFKKARESRDFHYGKG